MKTTKNLQSASPSKYRAVQPPSVKCVMWSVVLATCLSAVVGCVDGDARGHIYEEYTERTAEIRNGTREPQSLGLTPGETLSIGWLHFEESPAANFCSGTLIAPRVVITARHCTASITPDSIGFGVGLEPSDWVASFAVSAIVEHEDLDVAMVILDVDATAHVSGLEPIEANLTPLGLRDQGRIVEAAGYGETFDETRTGRWFASLRLEQVRTQDVIVNGDGKRGICFGDSGGPLLWTADDGKPRVLAVESYGDQSCLGRDSMVRLDALGTWLTGTTGQVPHNGEPPDPNEPLDCENLDWIGRCAGDRAQWCSEGEMLQVDCAEQDLVCRYINDDLGYYCALESTEEPPPLEEPECTFEDNTCDGDVRVFCDRGRFVRQSCEDLGLVCGLDARGAPLCVSVPDGETGSPDPQPPSNAATPPQARGACSVTLPQHTHGLPWSTWSLIVGLFCALRIARPSSFQPREQTRR